jgi:DNA-binding beta-propeller fold protein YncE
MAPTPALAVEEHSFDPVLSLRGDCSTSALDEVPDPGLCPIPPGIPGVDHPPKAFEQPCGVATDLYGDIYVASAGAGNGEGREGRIDVFDPQGHYLTEVKDEYRPCSVAVDSQGNLYVTEIGAFEPGGFKARLVRFDATGFPPSTGAAYGPRTILVEEEKVLFEGVLYEPIPRSVAVDPSNDHVYVAVGTWIQEYGSASEGNPLIRDHLHVRGATDSVAVYGKTHQIYTTGFRPGGNQNDPSDARVLVLDAGASAIDCEIDASATPDGTFDWAFGDASIAVDQSNGDVYVADITPDGHESVDQFNRDCEYLGQVQHSFKKEPVGGLGSGLAVDAPCLQAAGEICGGKTYDSPNEGNLYVAQGRTTPSYHLYAFRPKVTGPPAVEEQAVSGVTDTGALLTAKLNPEGLDTHYHFQYISQADYEADGGAYGAGAADVPLPDLDAGSGGALASVSVSVSGLTSATAYRFRLVATNCEAEEAIPGECLTVGEGAPGGEGEDANFRTFSTEVGLPDGRGYELVTPPDTNGRIPTMSEQGRESGINFDTRFISTDGESVVFGTEGGSIPALGGGGFHDTYEAVRTPSGWQSHFSGLDATQAEQPYTGGIAPDHSLAFWAVGNDKGSLAAGTYLRSAAGSIEPIGIGDFGEDLSARGMWITAGGSHIIFATGNPKQASIYERSPGGPTQLLSVLPDGQAIPAEYQGTAADGSAVAFNAQGNLYVRLDGTETVQAAEGTPVFGGLSENGGRIVYLVSKEPLEFGEEALPRGEIFTCQVSAGACAGPAAVAEPTEVGSGEESILVNVSADGSHIYFVSSEQLDGGKGKAGGHNLYVWDAGSESTHFIAAVTDRDLSGQPGRSCNTCPTDGLGLWVQGPANPLKGTQVGPGADSSRTSADGTVLLFESRAQLTAYENGGFAEVYRFDATSGDLSCLSCNPSGEAARSDALLQLPLGGFLVNIPPVSNLAVLGNLSPDGRRAYFQTADRLVLGDVDGNLDVYEWEAAGEGTCEEGGAGYLQTLAGCVYLISSGRSPGEDYLYGVTPNGSDVIFESSDRLVPQDPEKTPSLYDARVGGGFPPPAPPAGECLGESCQPAAVPRDDPTPASASFEGAGNVREKARAGKRCPRGRHAVTRKGRRRCLKPHGKKPHHHKTKKSRRAGR